MPVPDTVIFGPSPVGANTYGDIRKLEEADQFLAIRDRVGAFFNTQVSELGIQADGKKKVYSPFPLFLLTCIGIETLGHLFFARKAKEGEDAEEVKREPFLKACGKVHQKFSRILPEDQKVAFDALWGEGEHKKHKTVALLVYRLGRNTMAHGYQSRGVYLTEDHDDFEMIDGGLVMNPYKFWCSYLNAYEKLWADFLKGTQDNDPRLVAMRAYRDKLLG